jgi:MOSC domain-containing protein YiiM
MKVVSVNVGLPRTVQWKRKAVSTDIFKTPVSGRVQLIGPVVELFQGHRLGCTPAAHGVQTRCRIRGQRPHVRRRRDALRRRRDGPDASPEVP